MSDYRESLVREVIRAFAVRPNDWEQTDKYYAVDKESGLKLWVANKAYGVHLECPERLEVSGSYACTGWWSQKARLWRAYQRWLISARVGGLLGRLRAANDKAEAGP